MAAVSVVLQTKLRDYKKCQSIGVNFIVFPELLAQGGLLTVVPERLITNLLNLKRFEPPLEIQGFTKTLIWHERIHKDLTYRWVRELIEKICLVEEK